MKKILVLLMLVIMTFSGCQKKDQNVNDATQNTEDTTQEGNKEDSSDSETPAQDSTVTNTPEDAEDANDDNEIDNESNGQAGENQIQENELSSIIKQIYEIKEPGIMVGDIPFDLTNMDSVKYFTGLTDLSKVKNIAASEAMIGSQAYSLVLVQLNDAKDAETVAKDMLNGIDQRKWICVEADDLQVVAQDDVIMLIMVAEELSETVTSQEIVDAFQEVRGGDLTTKLSK